MLNVALVFGGRSVEHDVSVNSAKNISSNADISKFNILPFGISKKGKWYLMDEVNSDIEKGIPLTLTLDASAPVFQAADKALKIDVVFIILHGTDGEDGSIQGLFTTMNIPFVGSDVLGSALAMNKITAKKILLQENIPTAKSHFLTRNEDTPEFEKIAKKLGTPMIVKPARLGSSVGVSKISNENEYIKALNLAFNYDSSLLIEEFVNGRELECAVFGNEDAIASPAGEVELNNDYEIYSFDAKYVDGEASTLHIPAKLNAITVEKIKELSLKAYHSLGCMDLSRIDLFLKENGEVIVNEINTLPGFTNISMYPKLCELMGMSYMELITKLILMAMKRKEHQQILQTEYLSGLSE